MYCSCYTLFSLYSYRLTVLEIAGRESKTRELYCFECARESIKQRFRRIKYQYTFYPNHLTKANKHRNQRSLYACQSVSLGIRALTVCMPISAAGNASALSQSYSVVTALISTFAFFRDSLSAANFPLILSAIQHCPAIKMYTSFVIEATFPTGFVSTALFVLEKNDEARLRMEEEERQRKEAREAERQRLKEWARQA